MAGLGIAFLLLALLVQMTATVMARNTVEAAVSASARRAARPGIDLAAEESRLARDVTRSVPGATALQVEVAVDQQRAVAAVKLQWSPPGPTWRPLLIESRAVVARVVPP